jgi:hypothetical protein
MDAVNRHNRQKTMKQKTQDNPQHVDNLNSIKSMEAQGFKGTDADLATSLFEYGLAWRELETEWLFVYGIDYGETEYNRFDRCTIAKDTNPLEEWEWVNWDQFTHWFGDGHSFEDLVASLVIHHGFEDIFGSSYWEGFSIKE